MARRHRPVLNNTTDLDEGGTAAPGRATVPPGASPSSLARRRIAGLGVIAVALVTTTLASFTLGSNALPPSAVWHGLLHRDGSDASAIIWDLRIPRAVVAVIIGSAFGVAGAVIQALTRNPLADPGILGVNAGAGFAVTVGVGAFGVTSTSGYIWFAFVGAAVTTVVVHLIAAGGGTSSPVTLVLSGVALGAVLGGLSTFLTLIDDETFRSVRRWGLGSIARTGLTETLEVAPFLAVGLLVAIGISGGLNSIALGDDLAASLGTRVARIRVLGLVSVTLLAGGATALTGGIAFVGLMVPHVVRWFVGPDQRWIIAYSALAAPVLVLVSDTVGRIIARPGEVEVGVVTAVIGAPVLIALVRRRRASGL